MKDKKHIRLIFIRSSGSCMHVWNLRCWGGQKFNFLNMVMWHIKLKGMSSDQDTLKIFTLGSNWWPWGGVKGSNTIRYLRERGDLRWRAIECVLVVSICLGKSIIMKWVNYERLLYLLNHNNTFWRPWNIMYLKILWKKKHLLFRSKCSIFHNIFKSIQNLT